MLIIIFCELFLIFFQSLFSESVKVDDASTGGMLTSASSHLHLLFVAYAFFRLPALLVEHFLAFVIVVDLLSCAGKIVPGG